MISAETARAALAPLWQVMVELAESANDTIIDAQRRRPSRAARAICSGVADLGALAQAAAVLARASKGEAS